MWKIELGSQVLSSYSLKFSLHDWGWEGEGDGGKDFKGEKTSGRGCLLEWCERELYGLFVYK